MVEVREVSTKSLSGDILGGEFFAERSESESRFIRQSEKLEA